jgi:phosphohistidine phosphatase SixA
MKKILLYTFLLITLVSSCKKSDDNEENEIQGEITSAEFIDELLFVNKNSYKIETSEPATFSSTDPSIDISADGVIARVTSGEVVPIEVTWTGRGTKTTIYALGATDNNHVKPFENYHSVESTDPYNQYVQGWATLRKLPASGETYSIILRHADADNGRDLNEDDESAPANWWKSCDSTLARQLNQVGKERATELGKVFKDLQYPITRVYSSEFCRAISTATLINAGPTIELDGRINHPAYNMSTKSLFRGLLDILNGLPVDNNITLVSTHHPINEFGNTGIPTIPRVSAFNWTGAYFLKIASDKTVTYEGAVSWGMFKYWRDLKLNRL